MSASTPPCRPGLQVAEGQITTQPLLACIGTSQDIGHHIVDYTVQQGCNSLVVGSRGMGETRRWRGLPGGGGTSVGLLRGARRRVRRAGARHALGHSDRMCEHVLLPGG